VAVAQYLRSTSSGTPQRPQQPQSRVGSTPQKPLVLSDRPSEESEDEDDDGQFNPPRQRREPTTRPITPSQARTRPEVRISPLIPAVTSMTSTTRPLVPPPPRPSREERNHNADHNADRYLDLFRRQQQGSILGFAEVIELHELEAEAEVTLAERLHRETEALNHSAESGANRPERSGRSRNDGGGNREGRSGRSWNEGRGNRHGRGGGSRPRSRAERTGRKEQNRRQQSQANPRRKELGDPRNPVVLQSDEDEDGIEAEERSRSLFYVKNFYRAFPRGRKQPHEEFLTNPWKYFPEDPHYKQELGYWKAHMINKMGLGQQVRKRCQACKKRNTPCIIAKDLKLGPKNKGLDTQICSGCLLNKTRCGLGQVDNDPGPSTSHGSRITAPQPSSQTARQPSRQEQLAQQPSRQEQFAREAASATHTHRESDRPRGEQRRAERDVSPRRETNEIRQRSDLSQRSNQSSSCSVTHMNPSQRRRRARESHYDNVEDPGAEWRAAEKRNR
jgi:hypothetical protein